MKFKEMPYERIDAQIVKDKIEDFTKKLAAAVSYEEARALFLAYEEESKHFDTMVTLAQIRHSIDTRDKFYEDECNYYNEVLPEIEEYSQNWMLTLLKSPFRPQFEEEFGKLEFLNTEIALKTFSPEIVPLLQEENQLTQDYEKLLASAQIEFRGKTYTLAQLGPFKVDPDDATRKEAFTAEGSWYKANQAQFDEFYDKLVHLRDEMGKKLGYEGFTTLGYYRMCRNCYT
ncbi:MAG: M3 family oligoendopeptidase, partial [Firmicutes bacterium]|nr:M3 family oligoendopeptidase [Bacillota bacterium]